MCISRKSISTNALNVELRGNHGEGRRYSTSPFPPGALFWAYEYERPQLISMFLNAGVVCPILIVGGVAP